MSLDTMKDLFREQLEELYGAEMHRIKALATLERASHAPALVDLLRRLAGTTQDHAARLEIIFDDLDLRPRRHETQGMQGLIKDCLNLATNIRAEPHVRDAAVIAAAQHVQHAQIAGYGCARTWARLLGHEQVAAELQKSLAEERETDISLSRIADRLNREAVTIAPA